MKPLFLKIESSNVYTIREQLVSYVNSRYYYHPQIELVYSEKSDGMCIIGDKVQIVKEGDIFMLGENLPHLFRNDEKYTDKKLKVRVIVLHFLPDFGGKDFLELPDMRNIKLLLKKAERGILVEGKTRTEVGKIMKQMLTEKGPGKMILLLQALTLISNSRETKMILPIGFQPQINEQNEDRINDVYSFTMQHFNQKIHTKQIASVAHLSEHSFCRYFKSKTGKTYTNFLHEIRIKHACKLLIESKLSISQIINECGFVNYANFFRYFKMLTGKTPAEYQKLNNDLITEK
ncbi:MAG: AraC family transcriptional regulator [Chitinophagaceae bacterium]|nr:AraC family transcriptional regulator [Chitinophagaceae bacterium]